MGSDYLVFDGDNHYYEALDAFTRYTDPKMAERCVYWCEVGRRRFQVVGGKVNHAVVNPTFNPIAKAGAMYDYFRGNEAGRKPGSFEMDREPLPAHYHHPDARVKVMDQQGLEKVWLFPTLGVLYEEALKHDTDALCHTFTAFNRWLDEDWGCNYQDRIYAAPYIPMGDVDHAVSEFEWAVDRDAHVIVIRPAPATTRTGRKSPFDSYFDPFWARVNEAGITVAVHGADSGWSSQGYVQDERFGSRSAAPSIRAWAIERSAYDFLAQAMFEKLFVRFPNLRLAMIENGSAFLRDLLHHMESQRKKSPWWFSDHDPVETFKQHVWVNPFWEDDPYELVDVMGIDRVLFGSDWPHIEGLPEPLNFVTEITKLDPADQKKVLRDNIDRLNVPQPV